LRFNVAVLGVTSFASNIGCGDARAQDENYRAPSTDKGFEAYLCEEKLGTGITFFLPFPMLCEYFHVYTAQQMLVMIATKVHASD